MSEANIEPALSRQAHFKFGAVPDDTAFRARTSTTPPLGPLAAFAGTFTGRGFNTIFRPNSTATPTQLPSMPPEGPPDNVLELNLTTETLSFSAPLGLVPNRGSGAQPDAQLNGVPYLQTISDVTIPSQPVGIHFEPGLWMHVPATTIPEETAETVVRMASIPHGTTIEAQGTFTAPIAGKPPFTDVLDITPNFVNGPKFRFPSQNVTDEKTERIPQDLTSFVAAGTITQDILDNPNLLLKKHIANQNVTSFVAITINTKPAAPLFGGGTDNIAFLLGDPTGTVSPNANATQISATFWIETVEYTIEVPPTPYGYPPRRIPAPTGEAGQPVPTFLVDPPFEITEPRRITVSTTQIQYSQTVLLVFAGLVWPHASVATLVPNDPIPIPRAAWGQA
jgi:hypothetical protein